MHKKTEAFLDDVCAHIRFQPIHAEIREELALHIDELKASFSGKTQTEEDAIDRAIAAMGDACDVGRKLDKQHRPQTEWSLIVLTALIVVIGGIVIYVSSKADGSQILFDRYLMTAGIGVLVAVGLYFYDYTKLRKMAAPLYLLAMLLLVMTILTRGRVNGRYMMFIGGNAISTEFTTIFFMIAFAGFLDQARGKGIAGLITLIVLGAGSCMPIVIQPRLSQALTLCFGYAVLTISAVGRGHFGGRKAYQFGLLGLTACLGFLLPVGAIVRSMQFDRFLSWFDRADAFGRNFQSVQATRWLSVSEFFGAASQTVDGGTVTETLPAAATDFALVNVFATLGWAIGVGLIILFVVYMLRMCRAAYKIKNSFGHNIALFACSVLSVQFAMGLLVNFSFFPSGSMIPFITYGGVGFISSMAAIGLILSAWRRNRLTGAAPLRPTSGSTALSWLIRRLEQLNRL